MNDVTFNQGIKAEILHENPKFTSVVITGKLAIEDIKKSGTIYVELLKKGVKRVFIDLSNADTDFAALVSSHDDLNKGLSGFEKVAIIVKDSGAAFKVKAAAKHNEKIQIYYTKPDAVKFLED